MTCAPLNTAAPDTAAPGWHLTARQIHCRKHLLLINNMPDVADHANDLAQRVNRQPIRGPYQTSTAVQQVPSIDGNALAEEIARGGALPVTRQTPDDACLRVLRGVTRTVLTENMKAIVLDGIDGQPCFNPKMVDLAS